MKMKSRKKGYQTVALFMAIIVAGSCFISCGSQKENNEKELYNEYLKSTLIPQYGLADLSNFNTDFEMEFYKQTSPNYSCTFKDREISLDGIASTYIDDMNEDGVEDMILVRFKVNTDTATIGKIYGMTISAYTLKDDKVILLDEEEIGKEHCFSVDDGFEIAQKEWSDRNFYISAITDGKKKYIFVESIRVYKVSGNGIYEYQFVYELDDNELKIPHSIKQVDDDETYECLIGRYNECTEPEGDYTTYDEAIVDHYFNYKINVKSIEDKYEERHSVISDVSLVNSIFSYEWYSADYKSDGRGIKAIFNQVAQDYTNVSKLENQTSNKVNEETTVDIEKNNEEESVVDEYKIQKKMYKKILDKYYTAIVEEWDAGKIYDEELANNLIYYADNLSEFGFKFIDIDGNGVDELFVGSTDFAEFKTSDIAAIYTIVDNKITLIAESQYRNKWWLCENNIIRNSSTPYSRYSSTSFLELEKNGQWKFIEGVLYDVDKDKKNPWFYSNQETKDDYQNPISEDEKEEVIDKYKIIDIFYITFSEYK